ncbi:hypothetical protein J437_LFUL004775 [Ladona fulva]|uniref:RING-type domain-containing protein n=1 Tax=Ladona fulva TaxID=123851 RepID=A0A8K0NXP1_LADFU|nr:hypothetical protein J437_LFUL004775 [Ladona fulva]
MAEGYNSRSYRLQEADERCFGRGGVNFHLGLGDSLARSGRLREAIGVYAYCCRRVGAFALSPDRLRHLAAALLEAVIGNRRSNSPIQTSPAHRGAKGGQGTTQSAGALAAASLPVPACFACPVCEGVLHQPVTASCGHTFCKKCLNNELGNLCVRCGHRLNVGWPLETNVLIKCLVEKWWSPELRAVQLRDEGNELFLRNQVEAALLKYDEAYRLGE